VARPISVVVCTMDRPAALERCVRGLLAGETAPAELVVVDQGTRPVERELVEALDGAGIGLTYLRAPGRGVSGGRNDGVRATSSDLIAFTDDDCVPGPGWIDALVSAYEEGFDGATGRVLPLPGPPGSVAVSSRTSEVRRTFAGAGHAPWDVGTGGNLSLRRAVIEAVGGFDERLGPGTRGRAAEDVDLLYRVVEAGFTILYRPEAVVYHETKTRRARVGGRFDYGYGLGAFLSSHAARGDRRARALRRRYVGLVARGMASGARHGNPWAPVEGALTLAGIAAGSLRRGRA
jgi:glycosyltransferase involved in cell wall biosynthesis